MNYLRANWIRPEDLHLYEELGYHNFKIVERNTPTQILLERVKAYAERRYDGNLLDLVQNYAYPVGQARRGGQGRLLATAACSSTSSSRRRSTCSSSAR